MHSCWKPFKIYCADSIAEMEGPWLILSTFGFDFDLLTLGHCVNHRRGKGGQGLKWRQVEWNSLMLLESDSWVAIAGIGTCWSTNAEVVDLRFRKDQFDPEPFLFDLRLCTVELRIAFSTLHPESNTFTYSTVWGWHWMILIVIFCKVGEYAKIQEGNWVEASQRMVWSWDRTLEAKLIDHGQFHPVSCVSPRFMSNRDKQKLQWEEKKNFEMKEACTNSPSTLQFFQTLCQYRQSIVQVPTVLPELEKWKIHNQNISKHIKKYQTSTSFYQLLPAC